MINLLLAVVPVTTTEHSVGAGVFAAWAALTVSILTPVIAALKAWSDRKTRRERNAAALQAEAQGGAIATGTPLEWRTTDHQALLDERAYSEKTRGALYEAEEQVRGLRDELAETNRRCDAIAEDLRQLRVSISSCPGGPHCPLGPAGWSGAVTG